MKSYLSQILRRYYMPQKPTFVSVIFNDQEKKIHSLDRIKNITNILQDIPDKVLITVKKYPLNGTKVALLIGKF